MKNIEHLFLHRETEEPEPMKREEILEQYQRTFTVINNRLFNNELPPIMIDYPEGDPEKWSDKECLACFVQYADKSMQPYIILQFEYGPEYGINTDDIESLCHELIHYFCYLHEIRDMDGPEYHNLNFKKAAEDHGATCSYIDEIGGYCLTEWPNEILEKIFDEI